jgi:hypothetical protein
MRRFANGCMVLGLAVAMAGAAEAQSRRAPGYGPGQGYVTAESRYGTATVTGAVRTGPHGRPEVQLPGGTWIECGRSCRDTLRRETVDFWQNRGDPRGSSDGPGYLRFRF